MARRRPGDPTDPGDPGPLDPGDPVDPRPPRPTLPPPPPPPPLPPEGANPSITSWTRLEVRSRQADMRASLSARVFDPLWLMARQWQMGEFQGEDAGMPVLARVRSQTTMLSRIHLGAIPANTTTQAAEYDPQQMPLEVMVERQRTRPAGPDDARMLRLSVEAGLHFLLMLDQQPLSKKYRPALVARFGLQRPGDSVLAKADEETRRFVETMVGRAPDARRLADLLRTGGVAQLIGDITLKIVVADRAEVQQTAERWLAWYDALFTEPAQESDDAWSPPRMEYALTVAGQLSEDRFDQRPLTASEFYDGHLDWSSFDLDFEVNLGTERDHKFGVITETTVPAPVVFKGAPAPRYWELEDARVEYGLMPVGPTDLAQLLMIEYASSYGNDWFVVPLTLPVGSLTAINSLVVTDSFGVRSLLQPIGARGMPAANWSMFQLAHIRRPGEDLGPRPMANLFFLPPALGRSLQSPAVEDVLFMRDEMANLAWAIERSLESPVEQPVPRIDTTSPADSAADTGGQAPSEAALPRYLLSTTVPKHWIPLLPVQVREDGKVVSRLRRGAVLQPDGSKEIHRAEGRILNKDPRLLMFDEEVPREGIHVARHYQLARWIDGSTWAWMALRKFIGSGEGSSRLRFDSVDTQE
ncbi:MAG TPA: hypothetical protein VJQ52_12845 [Steroidobacteraceae bacterium]|nr:hypothetical protein [Steroidobacteraceae bacterium]